MLDPTSLRHFVSVVEHGSIAGAAHAEHITASAISVRMNQLEKALGATLLIRRNRGVEPTAVGQELLRHARSLLAQLDHITDAIRLGEGTAQSVRVLASPGALADRLPDQLGTFTELAPTIRLRVTECSDRAVADGLREYAAELGVLAAGEPPDGLETVPYLTQSIVLVVPSGHELAGAEAVRLQDVPAGDLVNSCEAARYTGVAPDGPATGYENAVRLAAAGLGVALVPSSCAESAGHGAHVVELLDDWARRDYVVAYRSEDGLNAQARRLLSHLTSRRTRPSSRLEHLRNRPRDLQRDLHRDLHPVGELTSCAG